MKYLLKDETHGPNGNGTDLAVTTVIPGIILYPGSDISTHAWNQIHTKIEKQKTNLVQLKLTIDFRRSPKYRAVI